jgi:predicted AAA+ superfamily ATPase
MRDFRLYMLIGGMPQAVASYLETNNLEKVDSVKRSIITLYEDDFNKIDPTGNASKMFRQIPAQLTNNANRYLTWSVTDGARNIELVETISELKESMVVNIAHHANDPNTGMALHQNPNKYKMFAGDTGLFVTLAFWDKKFTDNTIYHKLLSDKLSTDIGYVYENVVAQMLKTAGHELYYYTFPTDSRKHNYEVDFLIADGDKVSPIEVKSSGYRTHASLDAFSTKFSSRINHKYLVYTKDIRKEGDVLYLPAYMTMFL